MSFYLSNSQNQRGTHKTLEELELDIWTSSPDDASSLVKRCTSLRKKRLSDFEVDDLRIMITQKIGLNYLVPIAIEILITNPFAEGDYYEGDLLESVLKCGCDFWKSNSDFSNEMKKVIDLARNQIEEIDMIDRIKQSILSSIRQFENC